MLGKVFRTEAIYDVLLESFLKSDSKKKKGVKERYIITVMPGSPADNKEVHDLLLPWSTIITNLSREGKENIVPSGETVLTAGDVLTVETETDNRDDTFAELTAIAGKQKE